MFYYISNENDVHDDGDRGDGVYDGGDEHDVREHLLSA